MGRGCWFECNFKSNIYEGKPSLVQSRHAVGCQPLQCQHCPLSVNITLQKVKKEKSRIFIESFMKENPAWCNQGMQCIPNHCRANFMKTLQESPEVKYCIRILQNLSLKEISSSEGEGTYFSMHPQNDVNLIFALGSVPRNTVPRAVFPNTLPRQQGVYWTIWSLIC